MKKIHVNSLVKYTAICISISTILIGTANAAAKGPNPAFPTTVSTPVEQSKDVVSNPIPRKLINGDSPYGFIWNSGAAASICPNVCQTRGPTGAKWNGNWTYQDGNKTISVCGCKYTTP